MSPLQVVAEAGKAHVSTQTPHPTEPEAPVERREDVVELLTVAGGAGGRSFSPLDARGSPSQASWGGGAEGVVSEPTENRIPLVDNSPLLVQDTSTKKVTSLTNEGVCVIYIMQESQQYTVCVLVLATIYCIIVCSSVEHIVKFLCVSSVIAKIVTIPSLSLSLISAGGFLQKKVDLLEGEHLFFLPHVVWKVFTSWYGTAGLQGGPALPRLVCVCVCARMRMCLWVSTVCTCCICVCVSSAYVRRKVRIRTILGFSCANRGS